MAASLDGYIADEDGGVGWLDPFNAVDYGYQQFFNEIGTVVMGRKTYDQAREFGPEWVYADKRGLVVASKKLENPPPDVTPWTDGIANLVQHHRGISDGDVWVVGGSQLQSALFDMDAIDRLELFLIPVLLGKGVPLFQGIERPQTLSLAASEQFDMGVVRLDYRAG
jgi:dihydrofolate reductase